MVLVTINRLTVNRAWRNPKAVLTMIQVDRGPLTAVTFAGEKYSSCSAFDYNRLLSQFLLLNLATLTSIFSAGINDSLDIILIIIDVGATPPPPNFPDHSIFARIHHWPHPLVVKTVAFEEIHNGQPTVDNSINTCIYLV